ncbi:MAG: PilT/PilU family type 4a pilus ATPase [Ignavibacteriaceae bacterium]|nr:PilT/PilU family type 4a pilus ATPase [Ignavibacteriaceae bacterium]
MTDFNNPLLTQAKMILAELKKPIPQFVIGPERVSWLIDNFHKISDEHKVTLIKYVNFVLDTMIKKESSDIEIGGHACQGYIWMRVFGKKDRVEQLPVLDTDEYAILILNLLNENQRKNLILNRNLDFSYSFKPDPLAPISYRFRADAYFDLDCLCLNMRSIAAKLRKVETLGFHPAALKMMHHANVKQGLVLVTGITGSGKSATLDALVDMHNETDNAHIIIIAAPIEFVHRSSKCIIRHREVGRDVASFKDGVIQALRQDPDIIIIGEMRDPETIMAALEVADTGHKVFSTLHTSSAVESLDRIIAEVHPSEQERVRNRLADTLTAVVSQKLVPSIDGRRVLAKEVMLITPSIQAAIKNNNISEIYGMINQGSAQGMITMEQDLKMHVQNRKISVESAIGYANNKTRIKQLLGLA